MIGYRDIADTQAMIDCAWTHSHAVVIGGGLLGLEAANGLKQRGMDVTVVHLSDWLLERQLDRTAGKLLQGALEARGIRFPPEHRTQELMDNGSGRVCAVQFNDGDVIPADLVVMAAGIRPNTELAESAGIPCNRGILVNDTLQTYDPRIYAVGECANHRGIAYGLVAPLFEQAKVCANHLAHLGYARYQGSVTSTKLKVTGIDLFSAGDFIGGEGSETITLSDPIGGVYKKLVIKDDVLVGACLYGDTADGGWYFRQIRENHNVAQIRDHLMFGENALGDVGHQGQNSAASMPRHGRSMRLQRRLQGHHRQGDTRTRPVQRRRSQETHQGRQLLRLLRGIGGTDPDQHRRRRRRRQAEEREGHLRLQRPQPRADPQGHSRTPADQSRRRHALHGLEDPERLCHLPPGPELLPDLDLAGRSQGRSAVAPDQRTRPRQHPEGRHLLGGTADVGRRDQRRRVAAHRRRRRQVPGADGQGHRWPAHRPAGGEEGRPAGHLERPRHALRTCLRQIHPAP